MTTPLPLPCQINHNPVRRASRPAPGKRARLCPSLGRARFSFMARITAACLPKVAQHVCQDVPERPHFNVLSHIVRPSVRIDASGRKLTHGAKAFVGATKTYD